MAACGVRPLPRLLLLLLALLPPLFRASPDAFAAKGLAKWRPLPWRPLFLGAEPAPDHKYRFMVSVCVDNTHVCGGVIVTPRWVMTAVICCFVTGRRKAKPMAGVSVVARPARDAPGNVTALVTHVRKMWTMPGCSSVAILQLDLPRNFTPQLRSVRLFPRQRHFLPFSGKSCEAIGWGLLPLSDLAHLNDERFETRVVLQVARVVEVPRSQCKTLDPDTVCVVGARNTTVYVDDAGSALLCGHRLVGLLTRRKSGS